MGEWHENSWLWRLEWRRLLYEWEHEEVQHLQRIINQSGPKIGIQDGVLWKHTQTVEYPTKLIATKLSESLDSSLPKEIISIVWQKFIPPRANVIVWLAAKEKLRTGRLLTDKGIITPLQAACPFCGTYLESNSHLLFECRFSWSAWMEILKWWGVSAPIHNQCSTFCLQWIGLVKGRKNKDIWALTLGCVLWSLWYERNQIKFESKVPNQQNFVVSLKIRIGLWAKEILGSTSGSPNVIHHAESFVLQAL